MKRDDAVISEFRETRALALAGAVDAVSSRAIGLRLDLFACMEENALLKAKLLMAEAEIEKLKAEIASHAAPG